MNWHALELYGFIHFTVNTFTGMEWGYGDESPAIFNPSDFNAGQIAQAARAGGLKGLILTCKHHDGFCLWPSAYTEHSIKNSPWRGGKGDIVGEISQACARQGLKFGVYLSPWDRNHPAYGFPAYIDYYRSQLKELLTQYGPISEVWFDGANGGDGFYGGKRETRWIDKTSYYDWDATFRIVRELQPDACIFSDAGPDIRWVGNEDGIAGDPCWSTLNTTGLAPGLADAGLLNSGERQGSAWLPAECDVSIRPGWFYHSDQDDQVKPAAQLLDLYFHSVGRGAALLLNLPPDRRGRIHENDVRALAEFRGLLDQTFHTDLARRAERISAGQVAQAAHPPANLVDGDPRTFWLAQEASPAEVVLEFAAPLDFEVVSLREYLPLGQRVSHFGLDLWQNGAWVEFYQGQSIGNRRLVQAGSQTTTRLRLRVLEAALPAALSEFALY